MLLKENNPDNKLSGIYYTPDLLAETIKNNIDRRSIESILEPSCGQGVFLKKVSQKYPDAKVTAIDNDTDAISHVQKELASFKNIYVSYEDFFDFYEQTKGKKSFDLIIGNPPYIRYQYLTEKQRELQSEILSENGMKSNKLINAWVAFLVACVNLLSQDGIIAFVIPAELLQVAYAEELRIFLTKSLDDITVITFKELIFSDVQQETIAFYGKKGNGNDRIRVVEADDIEDFKKIDLRNIDYQCVKNKNDKWTKYFVSGSETELLDKIRRDKRFKNFKDFGLINVGITTGNNKYFSITKDTEEKYGLSKAVLPLIGRSSHVHGVYFTRDDWEENLKSGKRAMLLSFPDVDYDSYPEGYKEYIALGEENGENKGYKCRIRERWYIVPSVWVPDAFFLRRNHLYPKFVLNRCGAVSTDTMHRIKFNPGVNDEDVLLGYYNSISFAFTEICGRSYGGGVLEILPGEMGNIRIPDVSKVDLSIKRQLLEIVDDVVREDRNIEEALDKVDQVLLIESLGIPKIWCQECRKIWKTMQQRRLGRGEKI